MREAGSLNLLEPSGPHQACYGTALPLPLQGQVILLYPGILFEEGSTNSVEDRGQRERGSGGGSPLVRASGGRCNLVQEISFHIVKFS